MRSVAYNKLVNSRDQPMIQIEPGLMVTDHIRLVRPLAKGAMGDVWIAHHENLNIEVAVKLIAANLKRNKVAWERFRREARCAAQLRGRHVVRVFDQGGDLNGLAYIVMELLEGETLRERLAQRRRMPLNEVGTLVRHVSRALSEAHRLGIVHRDVKPANIFLAQEDGERVIKLLDFGVATRPKARDQKTLTEVGALIGSPNYMSPEQLLNSKGVDHTCDLWALAAVAYRALTGRPPFLGENVGDIAMAVIEARFPMPTSVDPQLPDSIDEWFTKMLNKDRKQRFGSAEEMSAAFDAAGGKDEEHITLKRTRPVINNPITAPADESNATTDEGITSSGTRRTDSFVSFSGQLLSSGSPVSSGQPLSSGQPVASGHPLSGQPLSSAASSGHSISSMPPSGGSISSMPPSGDRRSSPGSDERVSTPGSGERVSTADASEGRATSDATRRISTPELTELSKAPPAKKKRWLKTERIPPEAARELQEMAKSQAEKPLDERATRRWSRDNLDRALNEAATLARSNAAAKRKLEQLELLEQEESPDSEDEHATHRRDKPSSIPVSHRRKRQQSPPSKFVSGSYVRMDHMLETAETSGEQAKLQSPGKRRSRVLLWLLLFTVIALAVMTALERWM